MKLSELLRQLNQLQTLLGRQGEDTDPEVAVCNRVSGAGVMAEQEPLDSVRLVSPRGSDSLVVVLCTKGRV